MYDIQLNESGTRHLTITRENLQTLHKYNLLAVYEEYVAGLEAPQA